MTPTRVGQLAHGGYFVGYVIADGNLYELILSPESSEVFSTNEIRVDFKSCNITGYKNTHTKVSSDAIEYCRHANINGYDDWYLPTMKELQLVSCRMFNTSCTVNNNLELPFAIGFRASATRYSVTLALHITTRNSGLFSEYYWTRTVFTNTLKECYTVNLNSGFAASEYGNNFHLVRPVRQHSVTLT